MYSVIILIYKVNVLIITQSLKYLKTNLIELSIKHQYDYGV